MNFNNRQILIKNGFKPSFFSSAYQRNGYYIAKYTLQEEYYLYTFNSYDELIMLLESKDVQELVDAVNEERRNRYIFWRILSWLGIG